MTNGFANPKRNPVHRSDTAVDAREPSDLAEVIGKRFPAKMSDPLDRETADHEFVGSSRTRVYVAQKSNFERLEAHAMGDGGPLVVLGAPGVGKTALLANWALDHRRRHPEQLVLLHFIGATSQSTDWTAMLRRIIQELRKQLQFELHIPEDPDALRSAFAIALHAATVKTRVVLVLDALNQLEDRGGALSLAWLPPEIPARVRLILSTLPGRLLQELNRRGYPTLTLTPLSRADRANLIVEYVRHRGQTLDAAHVDRIASSDQAANPLYVRLVLDELQFVTSPEYLAGRIGHYLTRHSRNQTGRSVTMPEWASNY
jgi:hypothetical protein